MNKTFIASLLGTAIAALSLRGQATFQNLDFEAAHNLPQSGGTVPVTNALPGWSAFSRTTQLSVITYNDFNAVPPVGLYGSNSSAIAGNFGVLLSNGGSISQTGLIPADARSLTFKGSWPAYATPLAVSLGDQTLSYTAISNGPNYTLYGADISTFAGQTAKLAFSSPSLSPYRIDDIQFLPRVVPGPSTPPEISCAPSTTAQCSSTGTVSVAVRDPDGDSLTVMFTLNGTAVQTNAVVGNINGTSTSLSFSTVLPSGTNIVGVTATDSAGSSASCATVVTVVDTIPPVIHSVTAQPDVLWPPNHEMRTVNLDAVVTDECGPTDWKITNVTSNESDNARGSGHFAPDWKIKSDHTVALRAERVGRDHARFYTITIQATDLRGNTSQATATVTVPNDRDKETRPKGPPQTTERSLLGF